MGLDITAYRKISPRPHLFDCANQPTSETEFNHIQFHIHPEFPGRADDIQPTLWYSYTEALSCLNLSYGDYNIFRLHLARLAGYPCERKSNRVGEDVGAWLSKGGPFWELINFSDCEGTIGAAVAAKLSKDFADFQTIADSWEVPAWPYSFSVTYNRLRASVEMAADSGALKFH